MVTTSFPRWHDDSRQHLVLEAARALQSLGVNVRVIALHAPGARTKELLESIEVVRPRYMLPERLEILQSIGGGLPVIWSKSRLARLEFLFAGIAQALSVINHTRDCDIVHAHWTLSAASVWITRFCHRHPYIVTVHGSDIFQAAQIPLIRKVTQIVLNRASRVVATTRSLFEATTALGVSPRHIEIVPEAIDADFFRPSDLEREPLILFVGSLIERKGTRDLIAAMTYIRQKSPGYRLVIVGEGPQRSTLENLASKLRLTDWVSFVGAQSQDQVRQWMQRARLVVLPSLEEAFGIVLLEALACGTPCVGTQVGGIPEIISPEVGCLVPPANPEALADAIDSILEREEVWQTMSQSARRRVEECGFTWSQVAARLVQVYHSVLRSG